MLPWFLHLCDGGAGGLDQKGSKIPCPLGAPFLSPTDPSPPTTSPWPPSWWWTLRAFRTPGTRAETGLPPSRSCATITSTSACSCSSTSVSALERFREVWLGWAGASGAHPGFSFMLSGPALIKTQSAGLAARASAPPPSPSVSHGLLHFSYGSELGAPQALLPQLSLVWADQFLLTHTPKLKCSPAVRCSLCVEGPSCPSHLWVKTVWFAQSLGHSMGASTKGGHAAALQEALQAGQDAQAHSCMPAFTSLKKLD